ncbi:V-set domain-containing T-cell activation inhibitor 1-like isoform X1 [Oreochromis aureus]|uniref:V-set domain-containing T-cell activation inhibitor 1-like isoform X1 n=1 Tax=Oreochromis aureus TaxID=47969 RepID=UPI0019546FA9|nr:V-set domain-containing T-cell activation inhibitor 1-like isoform X1 [Oreochromis aureus]
MSRMMAGIKCVVFLVVLIFQWTHARGDTEVSCIFMESCMLPCSYSGSDVVINWTQVSAGDLNVHSFYNNQDQLKLQNEHFRGRTSLFNDQIPTGNASLQLTKVEVEDEGRYKCYTSTDGGNQESFINLKIKGSGNSGAILGGVIAAIVITGVVAAVGFMLYKRRKGPNPSEQQEPQSTDSDSAY